MKRFDIELFARSALREYTLTPKRIAWLQLLDQLKKKEQKRHQRIICIKVVLFITVFLTGFGSVRNKSIQHMAISPEENIGIIIPTADIEVEPADIEVEPGDKVSPVARNNDSTSKNDQVVVQKKKPQPEVHSDEEKIAALDEFMTSNKRSPEDLNSSPGIMVTDAEIESLMRKARKNIEKNKNLLKQQEILPVRESLVNAIDIEEEIELKGNITDVAFNNILREFLKIKSAFAN